MTTPRRLDVLAAAAGAIALLMVGVYVAIMRGQDDPPLAWVVVALLVGAGLAGYGAAVRAPYRSWALGGAVAVLGLMGLLAILSIGLPILGAAALAFVAFVRSILVRTSQQVARTHQYAEGDPAAGR
jgi:hypothetical protein